MAADHVDRADGLGTVLLAESEGSKLVPVDTGRRMSRRAPRGAGGNMMAGNPFAGGRTHPLQCVLLQCALHPKADTHLLARQAQWLGPLAGHPPPFQPTHSVAGSFMQSTQHTHTPHAMPQSTPSSRWHNPEPTGQRVQHILVKCEHTSSQIAQWSRASGQHQRLDSAARRSRIESQRDQNNRARRSNHIKLTTWSNHIIIGHSS